MARLESLFAASTQILGSEPTHMQRDEAVLDEQKKFSDVDFSRETRESEVSPVNLMSTKPTRLVRSTKHSNTTKLSDASLWDLSKTLEAERIAREPRYDGVDEWTGDRVESYVKDPPEANAVPINLRGRYGTGGMGLKHNSAPKRKMGEQIAEMPVADIKINGQELQNVGRIDNLGHRSLSHQPIRLKADDLTPNALLGENGAYGNFGDVSERKEYFHGGLHPKTRVNRSVNGQDNINSVIQHGSMTTAPTRILADHARTPSLRQNSPNPTQGNAREMQREAATRSEIPERVKVGRLPIKMKSTDLVGSSQRHDLGDPYKAKRNDSSWQHPSDHSAQSQIGAGGDTRNLASRLSKFRTLRNTENGLQGPEMPASSVRIEGKVPIKKMFEGDAKTRMYGETRTYGMTLPEDANTRLQGRVVRTDQSVDGVERIHSRGGLLQPVVNYASRDELAREVDRTQPVPRMLRQQQNEAYRIQNQQVLTKDSAKLKEQTPRVHAEQVYAGPQHRMAWGNLPQERNLLTPRMLGGNIGLTGYDMSSARVSSMQPDRINREAERLTSPFMGGGNLLSPDSQLDASLPETIESKFKQETQGVLASKSISQPGLSEGAQLASIVPMRMNKTRDATFTKTDSLFTNSGLSMRGSYGSERYE